MSDKTQELRPEALQSMLEYQEGAVVSRTLIQKKTGTLTLFAFDKDEGLSEHTSPYEAIVYMVAGTMTITISGEEYTVEGGEMLTLPADEPHALDAEQPCKMLLFMVRS